MSEHISFIESPDDFPDCSNTVAELIARLARNDAPDRWEHLIAYNYLVHQGTVMPIALQAFPHLVDLLLQPSIDAKTRTSLTHLCAQIYPATSHWAVHRTQILNAISQGIEIAITVSERAYLLASYARVAAGDELLADSIEDLINSTCPSCGEPAILSDLSFTSDSTTDKAS